MVFVVLEHADTVFNDEEEVDASQGCQALPHSIEGCYQIGVMMHILTAVVVLPLRLKTIRGEEDGTK